MSSERPGVFNCLTEGMTRLMGLGMPNTTRLFPIWKLLLPTGLVGLSRYIIIQMARYTVISTIHLEQQENRVSISMLFIWTCQNHDKFLISVRVLAQLTRRIICSYCHRPSLAFYIKNLLRTSQAKIDCDSLVYFKV